MAHYKISKLLNDPTVSKLEARKRMETNDLSSGPYSANKNVKFKTSMLRSYSDAYIVVKGTIDLLAAAVNESNIAKNNAPFR